MTDIVKLIQKQPNFYAMDCVTENEIKVAEQQLKLRFASDYRAYITSLGAASFGGHELTGICNSKRLNVVSVTLEERMNVQVPEDWYVLEQAHIDGIVLWQTPEGTVYQTSPYNKVKKLCGSLAEYIEM